MTFAPTPTQLAAQQRRANFSRTIQERAAALRAGPPVVEATPAPVFVVGDPMAWPVVAQSVEQPRAAFVPAYPSIESIKEAVCEFYGVSKLLLVATRRTNAIVEARHMAMYLCRELTPHSYPLIGKFLGDLDHTTVMYGFRKVEKTMLRRDETGARKAHEVATLLEYLTGVQQ